jgi:hypothetical protein
MVKSKPHAELYLLLWSATSTSGLGQRPVKGKVHQEPSLELLCLFAAELLNHGCDRGLVLIKQWCSEAQLLATGSTVVHKSDIAPLSSVLRLNDPLTLEEREGLATFASAKRAIPPSFTTVKRCAQAELEYCQRLTARERPIAPKRLRTAMIAKLRRYVYNTVRRAGPQPIKEEGPVNDKACMERSMSKGGTRAYLRDLSVDGLADRLLARVDFTPDYSAPSQRQSTPMRDGESAEATRERHSQEMRHAEARRQVRVMVGEYQSGNASPLEELAERRLSPAEVARWDVGDDWNQLSKTTLHMSEEGEASSWTHQMRNSMYGRVHSTSHFTKEVLARWGPDGTDGRLPTRPLVLAERGLKTRIASIFPASAVTVASRINGPLLRILFRNPVHFREGVDSSSVERALSGERDPSQKKECELLSADLSAASDWLELDVTLAVWDEICRAQSSLGAEGWTDQLKEAGAVLLGQHELTFDDVKGMASRGSLRADLEEESEAKRKKILDERAHLGRIRQVLRTNGAESKRGAAMGLGLTWPILSMVNAFCAQEGIGRRKAQRVRLLGDDMIARWEKRDTESYFHNLETLGLVVNREKSLRSWYGAVFAERYFYLSCEKLPASRRTQGLSRSRRSRPKPLQARILSKKEDPSVSKARATAVAEAMGLSSNLPSKETGQRQHQVPPMGTPERRAGSDEAARGHLLPAREAESPQEAPGGGVVSTTVTGDGSESSRRSTKLRARGRGPEPRPADGASQPDWAESVTRKLYRLGRVTLSALLLAKTKTGRRSEERVTRPIEVRLGDAWRQATQNATARTRERALTVARVYWWRTIGRMKKYGLPLFWPQALGGWGLPGKQGANEKWRRSAANWTSLSTDARPNLVMLLQPPGESELDRKVREVARDIMPALETVTVVRRGPKGRVQEAIVRDKRGVVGLTSPTRRFDRVPDAEVHTGDGSRPAFEDLGQAWSNYGPGENTTLIGLPAAIFRTELQVALTAKLRCGTLFSSIVEKPDESGDQRGGPPLSESQEVEQTLRKRTRRVLREVERLHSIRPGVNPVNPKRAVALTSSQRKLAVLVGFRSAQALCDLVGAPDTVKRAVWSLRTGPPDSCLLVDGVVKITTIDGEELAWEAREPAECRVLVEPPVRATFSDLCSDIDPQVSHPTE